MLKIDSFGPVRRLTMARSYFGRAFYRCHAYLVDDLLIDTGCPAAARPFQQFLDGENIRQAIVTHYHEDHAGNVISLNLSGIPAFAPESSLARVERGICAVRSRQSFYGKVFWGSQIGGEAQPLPATVETEQLNFQVHLLPGHSDDMTVFYEPKKGWLFSGDLFLGVRKNYWRREEHPLQVIDSLKKASSLDFEALFCGHAPALKGGRQLLKDKLTYLEEMKDKVQRLHTGGLDPKRIVQQLFGGEGYWTVITGGDFSRRNFVEGLLGD